MKNNWQKTKQELVYNGYRKITKKTFKLPNGKIADFDTYQENNTVCILAITKKHEVILAKQFRPGPEKILLELPGGGIEKKETPLATAKRELLEETGYAGDFKFVRKSLHCGYSNRVRYNFVAINCEKKQNISNPEDEFTSCVLMSMTKFRKHLQNGQLTDIATGYLGLDYLNLL